MHKIAISQRKNARSEQQGDAHIGFSTERRLLPFTIRA